MNTEWVQTLRPHSASHDIEWPAERLGRGLSGALESMAGVILGGEFESLCPHSLFTTFGTFVLVVSGLETDWVCRTWG